MKRITESIKFFDDVGTQWFDRQLLITVNPRQYGSVVVWILHCQGDYSYYKTSTPENIQSRLPAETDSVWRKKAK